MDTKRATECLGFMSHDPGKMRFHSSDTAPKSTKSVNAK